MCVHLLPAVAGRPLAICLWVARCYSFLKERKWKFLQVRLPLNPRRKVAARKCSRAAWRKRTLRFLFGSARALATAVIWEGIGLELLKISRNEGKGVRRGPRGPRTTRSAARGRSQRPPRCFEKAKVTSAECPFMGSANFFSRQLASREQFRDRKPMLVK